MRTLIIADIHGNLAALQAVLAVPHDHILCLGDIVGYGPEPADCVAELRQQPHVAVQGNHDRAVAEGISPRCSEAFRWLADATASIAPAQLTASDVAYLAALPRWAAVAAEAGSCLAVHATPTDSQYRYLGPASPNWSEEVATVDCDLLFVGHTHIQFDLRVGLTRVINPGSVGQPKDGDPRAAFAVMDEADVTLRRVPYDIEATVSALRARSIGAEAFAALAALLRNGRPSEMPRR